ncbi:DUF4832 domain-containing protein [Variovorax sp. WS11]|uniref:DUF4832 domain-containing protein n=1 Tax=Variovorax sp. WS11 TaxID=1105204 RepID=UPI0013DA2008|nr:DUF4832 domain-containing protein [Variovorax sp. WS11]NDZ16976.1 DUF4832 domain-containing protein [Variovorax sp. WS11]
MNKPNGRFTELLLSAILTAPGTTFAQLPGVLPSIDYPASSQIIPNPERGLYHHTGDCDKSDFSKTTLDSYKMRENITLVMCLYNLDMDSPQVPIAKFREQALKVRASDGLKMILRFAYSPKPIEGSNPVEMRLDAPLARVQEHMAQILPLVAEFQDVIAVIQSGFVGEWGEGADSKNFGNVGNENWGDRNKIVNNWLDNTPSHIQVQIRRPLMKAKALDYADLDSSTPSATFADYKNKTRMGRIGHHNDCFLRNASDSNTYRNVVDKDYVTRDSDFVSVGGETCGRSILEGARNDCPSAIAEMGALNYGYLNKDWAPIYIEGFQDQGCLPDIERRLGYRYELISTSMRSSATRGGRIDFEMTIINRGWAAAMRPRPVKLVLIHVNSNQEYKFDLTTTEDWLPGQRRTIARSQFPNRNNSSLVLPATMPVGNYRVALSIEDSLTGQPKYAVRIPNTKFDSVKGFNYLINQLLIN